MLAAGWRAVGELGARQTGRCRWGILWPRLHGWQVWLAGGLAAVGTERRTGVRGVCSSREEGPLWRAVRIRRGLAGNDPYRSASCERFLPDRAVKERLRQASGVGVMRQVSAGMPVLLGFAGVGRPAPGRDNESASLHTCAWGHHTSSLWSIDRDGSTAR